MKPLNIWSSCLQLDDNMTYLTKLLQAIPLTQALKHLHADFSVQVQHLGSTNIHADEQQTIASNAGFGREVYLCLQQDRIVWARSVCAQDAYAWHDIIQCGNQPLGLRLYELPLTRTEFEYAYLTPDHPANPCNQIILSRRSCFYLQDASALLLTESFLPILKHYE